MAPGADADPDLLSAWDFELPPERIAQHPSKRRDESRLLVLPRDTGPLRHLHFHQIDRLLGPGDLLVVNDTRVLPARVQTWRPTGGRTELLFLQPCGDGSWTALARPLAKLRPGMQLFVGAPGSRQPVFEVVDIAAGEARLRPLSGSMEEWMDRSGQLPLPPYIARPEGLEAADRDRYQTVYARQPGAIAAPTAGLHFTETLLERLQAQGVGLASVTLHVGLGTFAPIRTERLSEHAMHHERYRVPPGTAAAIASARRVVSVGTTSCRALEAWSAAGRPVDGGWRSTDLFIGPGHTHGVVDGLITNFHLPRTTLLSLVASFCGRTRLLGAYREAIAEGYRFYSYGDAMCLL